MGCNCTIEYPKIQNDSSIEIISNKNYKVFKTKSIKKNKEIMHSLIDSHKSLNENITKFNLTEKNEIQTIIIPKKSESKQRITKSSNVKKILSNPGNKQFNTNNFPNKSVIKNKNSDKNLVKKTKFIKVKKTHPERISYLKDITKDSFSYFYLDNTFTVFNSINNILTLVYATKEKSIVFFDLIDNTKINTIKGAHKELITNIRHSQDINNKKDLLLTISYNSNIKLWDYTNLECLTDIIDIYKNGYLFSACFLKDNNVFNIITSNYSENNDVLKVYDLTGNFIKNLNDSNGGVNCLDSYYDFKKSKNYIIAGYIGYVKSFDFNINKLYHTYREDIEDYNDHCSFKVNFKIYSKIVNLIESSVDGIIRIWNFHTSELLKKIIIYNKKIFGICLWSDNYIFIGCEDKMIKLVDIKNEEVINNLVGNNDAVLNIKKIKHPKYGDCLISQGIKDNQIKLWIKKFRRKKKQK